MAFVTLVPPPPLHPSVQRLWDWRVEPGELRFERILPQPGSSLIVNLLEDETRVYADDGVQRCERLAGVAYSGQFTRSFVIDTHEQVAVMGVAFAPGGARALLREDMGVLGNRHLGLDDLLGSAAGLLRERLLHEDDAQGRLAVLGRWLLRRCTGATLHPAVCQALAVIGRAPSLPLVDRLAADCGISTRRLAALFQQQVGVGTKRYLRLQRFRRVVDGVQRHGVVDWASVAADCGFHDQPHLAREFRAFSGMTPTAYVARRGSYVNHVAIG
ncbi:helix-turn-helix domain-containing protein [Dokdonella fugitiva]|uniref:helix-turn-helix domain-containing protein n=1 Tax=Dokdonella fugitiva TaxID=328517 RepID=UPI0015FB5F55|nr:AraC family transcriptional regulator [Dokdonella fugitiva]MBA8883408.1 AraC-like DNA-binding protein [Dokdonella fugitiva]